MKRLLTILALSAIASLAGCHSGGSNNNPVTGGTESTTTGTPYHCKEWTDPDGTYHKVCSGSETTTTTSTSETRD